MEKHDKDFDCSEQVQRTTREQRDGESTPIFREFPFTGYNLNVKS